LAGACLGVFLVLTAGIAVAAFRASTSDGANRVSAYTLPVPGNFRCAGLLNLLNPRLEWNAVTVPGGAAVTYVVTAPNGTQTTTSGTTYSLRTAQPLLGGTYRVRSRVATWNGWTSADATRNVTLNGLGLLYLCL